LKTAPECYPCFLQQVVNTLNMMGISNDRESGILRGVMETILHCPEDWSPPEISSRVYAYLAHQTGVSDPFNSKKAESNQVAMQMLPKVREMIKSAEDPLLMAVKAAIVGNIIDFGISHSFELEEAAAIANLPLAIDHYHLFKNEVSDASTVLYLADNAGEIGFDALLAEQLAAMGAEVTVAVRSAPVINDATLEDARFFGIHKVARLITSGSPAPGTPLNMVSREFKELFFEAEVVISKGQGNFETLDEAGRTIYFLLRAKCPVIARLLNVEMGSILLIRR